MTFWSPYAVMFTLLFYFFEHYSSVLFLRTSFKKFQTLLSISGKEIYVAILDKHVLVLDEEIHFSENLEQTPVPNGSQTIPF